MRLRVERFFVENYYKKMKLYFVNSKGIERLIAEPASVKECNVAIDKFLEEHNYKSYYTNIYQEPNGRIILDVGSHTEQFEVEGISFGEYISEYNQ